eukprot:TRINITY_DN6100_c0_g1_i5.p1 TRINITY_DN6100_c0_g1~~TRINITY_DN6100_c0_g1_i5.p1  ORF type:complete len:505 (+),score=112.51 TRINITY_DN6100_c0_g1_i5:119-1633(+)
MEDTVSLLQEDRTPSGRIAYYLRQPKWRVAIAVTLICLLAVILGVTLGHRPHPGPSPPSGQTRRNVILMISDGMGPASVTLARAWAGHALNLDGMLIGTVRTRSNNSWVTDSAAGATAYACGLKTYNNAIGVDADGVPCGTILEAAQAIGMKTGLVVTTRLTDATPSSFCAHAVSRRDEEFIAEQVTTAGVDLLFGGGRAMFSNATRHDGRDLLREFSQLGYAYVSDLQGLQSANRLPLLGLFADKNMPMVIDRQEQKLTSVPSLPDMTRKALELLSQSAGDDGFFLLVEGSQIDLAGHNNDAAAQVRETTEYDMAMQAVLEFAKSDGHTTVLSTSDHETGGLTLGIQLDPLVYDDAYKYLPDRLSEVTASASYMAELIIAGSDINDTVIRYGAVHDLTTEEEANIAYCKSNVVASLVSAIGRVVSRRAYIGFTTGGHTGVDVNLYGYNAADIGGNIDNTEVSLFIQRLLGLDVEEITEKLKTFNPKPPSNRSVPLRSDPYHGL